MLSNLSNWRFWMVLAALGIVAYSIFFTNRLAKNIAIEEDIRIKNYAKALESVSQPGLSTDISFPIEIISTNKNIPVILTDNKGNIIDHFNLGKGKLDSLQETKLTNKEVAAYITEFKKLHPPVEITLPEPQFIYYGESTVLKQLRYFPYVLLGIMAVFLGVIVIAFNNANKSLQNRLWVGMSKETAHQLGTPLMSMVGWLEVLKESGQKEIATEMQKDVDRLQLIADRFSKIGSKPQLTEDNILLRLQNMVEYMRRRSAKNISIVLNENGLNNVPIAINGPLFDWVVENLLRNSLDALQNKGTIVVDIINQPTKVQIDITDSGKGIPPKEFKKVFKPGFTTKQRGWGLGLSLAKRIITKYHHGQIFVLKSEPNVATTFRIILDR
jgi:signal transduction histidine kinase